jgi:hypothetical protein
MGEYDYIFDTIDSIQRLNNYHIYILINQPEGTQTSKVDIYENNLRTYRRIKEFYPEIVVIDRFSEGNGLAKGGVGEARKLLFNYILTQSKPDDIISSLDGDTIVDDSYLDCIISQFERDSKLSCIALPYYHRLTNDDHLNRKILYYEIYMRAYSINLSLIGSIYNFTPLGSAIAVKQKFYSNVGGYLPREAGEDFYLVQALVKNYKISNYADTIVYPASRESNRVPFGTGPAVSLDLEQLVEQYPIYDRESYLAIKEFYQNLDGWFSKSFSNSFTQFIESSPKNITKLNRIRSNFENNPKLLKLNVERYLDGVKILQFLKVDRAKGSDENLINLLDGLDIDHQFTGFSNCIDTLSNVRDKLFKVDLDLKR